MGLTQHGVGRNKDQQEQKNQMHSATPIPGADYIRPIFATIATMGLLGGLYLVSTVNYLLFHSLAEIFSIVVACSVFVIAWNSRGNIKNPYLLFIGIAYLFIGLLDLLHTLSYKGMSIFTDYDYYANQLWIAARYMESISLLAAFWFLKTGKLNRPGITVAVYVAVSTVIIGTIFIWRTFPVCFVEGTGLTAFKKNSEYVICGILVLSAILLAQNRDRFAEHVFRLVLGSIFCTIISELAFTFYISNYGFSNLIGHYFKLFSFYMIYRALIITGIRDPVQLVFYELENSNRKLREEVDIRRRTERQREKLIAELEQALEEIDTLKGILPICSFCKRIRDDEGHWHEVDHYIHDHSRADVSHSVCPTCLKAHYPELDLSSR